jgi:MFS family permease
MIMGIGLVGILIFAHFAAEFGNKKGIENAMMLGISLGIIGLAGIPFGGFIPESYRKIWILAANFIAGIGISFFLVNVNPFIMKNTTPFERTHVYSMKTAIAPIGGFFGSIVAGYFPNWMAILLDTTLKQYQPYMYTLFITPGILLISLFLLLAMDYDVNMYTEKKDVKISKSLPIKIITITSIVLFFQITGEVSTRNFMNIYLDEIIQISTSHIGFVLAAGNIATIPAALFTPVLEKRLGHSNTFLLASSLIVVSVFLIGFFQNIIFAAFGFVMVASLGRVSRISFIVYSMERVKQVYHTKLSAFQTLASTLGSAAIVLAGGFIIENSSYSHMFISTAFLTLLGTGLFFVYFKFFYKRMA